MTELKWLEGYAGQSARELLDLAAEYRIDSIVLAFEQALQAKAERVGIAKLCEAELTVLAVEALEREVNNGGYHQFFLNTPEYAASIVAALNRIDCPITAQISSAAIAKLGLKAPVTAQSVEQLLASDSDARLMRTLSEQCDGAYFNSGEPIADKLLAYLRDHIAGVDLTAR